MKKEKTSPTPEQIENMSADELEAFVCGRLYTLFQAFPSLEEYQRREAMEIVKKLEYMAPSQEFQTWSLVVDRFQAMADACRLRTV